jgi:hypothetical protein
VFDNGELDVGFPKFLGGPAGLVAAEEVGAVATQGVLELGDVPGIGKVTVRGADANRHEWMRLGKTLLQTADGFEDFVALFESAFADAEKEFLEGLGQAAALAATHGAFLGAAWLAAGQEIVNVIALEKFDVDVGIVAQALPTVAGEFALEWVEGVPFGTPRRSCRDP